MGIAPAGFSANSLVARLRSNLSDAEKYLAVLQKMADLNPNDPLARNKLGIFHYAGRTAFLRSIAD